MAEDLKVLADGRKYNYVLNFTKWKDTVTKLKKKKKKSFTDIFSAWASDWSFKKNQKIL